MFVQVETALAKCDLDTNAPTFILAECVLVYMRPDESEALLKMLASKFTTAVIVVRCRPPVLLGEACHTEPGVWR